MFKVFILGHYHHCVLEALKSAVAVYCFNEYHLVLCHVCHLQLHYSILFLEYVLSASDKLRKKSSRYSVSFPHLKALITEVATVMTISHYWYKYPAPPLSWGMTKKNGFYNSSLTCQTKSLASLFSVPYSIEVHQVYTAQHTNRSVSHQHVQLA